MNNKASFIVKIVAFTLMLVSLLFGLVRSLEPSQFCEPVVLGEGVTTRQETVTIIQE